MKHYRPYLLINYKKSFIREKSVKRPKAKSGIRRFYTFGRFGRPDVCERGEKVGVSLKRTKLDIREDNKNQFLVGIILWVSLYFSQILISEHAAQTG